MFGAIGDLKMDDDDYKLKPKYATGTIVMLAFRIEGYDRDCDGTPMAQVAQIDRDGKTTGWRESHIGLPFGTHRVLDLAEVKKIIPPTIVCPKCNNGEMIKEGVFSLCDECKYSPQGEMHPVLKFPQGVEVYILEPGQNPQIPVRLRAKINRVFFIAYHNQWRADVQRTYMRGSVPLSDIELIPIEKV